MATGRNPISDLEAIAAMPGLEQIAQLLAPYCPRPMEMVIFIAGQSAFGSQSELTSLLLYSGAWDNVVESAARVNRRLDPLKPPTLNERRHMLDKAGSGIGTKVAHALAGAMTEVVRAVGVLPTGGSPDLLHPNPLNIARGDGFVLKPGREDAKRYRGKTAGSVYGIPLSYISVRGPEPLSRVVLDIDLYKDGDEISSAMRGFRRVMATPYRSGVLAFQYDQLLNGKAIQEIGRSGVVPVCEMPAASSTAELGTYIDVPEHQREARAARAQTKPRAHCHWLRTLTFNTLGHICIHELWALDGMLVICPPTSRMPSFSDKPVPMVDLGFVPDKSGRSSLVGHHVIPCKHGDHHFDFDYTGDIARGPAVAEWARAINWATGMLELRGLRSDVESGVRHLKGMQTLFGRAGSYAAGHVLLDMVGAALRINAVAWDVHGSQHTMCGRKQAREIAHGGRSDRPAAA